MFVAALCAAYAALSAWLAYVNDVPWMNALASTLSVWFLVVGMYYMANGFYVMYRLLPRIDHILDPEMASIYRANFDPFFFRMHRLLLYSASTASRWAHRRMMYRDYDFQALPAELRLPLLAQYYLMMLVCALMAVAAMAMAVEPQPSYAGYR